MKRITDKQVEDMCVRLNEAEDTIMEAMKMAFDLAKEGDKRMYQIRGAFSGIREVSDEANGFLLGLRDCLFKEGMR